MERELCWLWLTSNSNIKPSKIALLLEHFGSAENIYFEKSFDNIKGMSDNEKSALLNKDLSAVERIMEKTARLGAKILVYDNENYPQLLKHITNPPYVLYIQGKVPELDKVLTIGVVGTRHSTNYGDAVTERMCRALAESGAVTVGGLASGIDAVGAWATLDAGGVAVGVIGSGLDVVYPRENAELYKVIAEKGCIITEYPPGTPPISNHFPARNRIIAGISRGVLITEAPKRSGALITARCAFENNRDVFAVPRNITENKFIGTNLLIQQGAKLVTSVNDILCEYPYFEQITPERRKKTIRMQSELTKQEVSHNKSDNDKKYENLNDNEKSIVTLLKRQDMQIDDMARALNMPVNELNTRLIMLEMKGNVKKLPGSKYQLKV